MTALVSESDLAAAAAALIGEIRHLSAYERKLIRKAHGFDPKTLSAIRASIIAGNDPLGDAFAQIRPPEIRRDTGAIYTPPAIINSMIAWAERVAEPARIVDPGAGSGRYIIAAGKRFQSSELVAIEIDPLAALLLRANLTVAGLADRTTILLGDFRNAALPSIEGRTLFVGNPPYVRHHNISDDWKTWLAHSAKEYGIKASKLAGLHVHFFLRTAQLAQAGDFGSFITASEWMDVNYGSIMRQLLGKRLGGVALHVLDPKSAPFANATTTGAIVCFRVGEQPDSLRVRSVKTLQALNGLSKGRDVPWSEVRAATRWSTIVNPGKKPPQGFIELGELCRVHRGQVTGQNNVWIAGDQATNLPATVLKPTVTKARDLLRAGDRLETTEVLRRVIDLPEDLDQLSGEARAAVLHFLKWAKRQGADQSYIAQHRRAWWSVGLRQPAPIICTYMARRPPVFVRNLCDARHINIAHGLYPREPLSDATLDALAAWLNKHVLCTSGRTYAGGLTKFEPKEIERIPVPTPEMLAA